MPNEMITPAQMAKDLIESIKEQAKKYQVETGCSDAKRKEVEVELAFGIGSSLASMGMES